MPNLYAIGAAAIVLLGLLSWGLWEKAEIADYKTQIERMNGEMAKAKADHDIAIADLNTELEKAHADHQHAIDAKNGDLGRLADDLDRLRAQSKACGNVGLQPAPVGGGAPASGAGKPASAVPSLDGSFQELNAMMAQCFAVAEYARTCHNWATAPAVSK